MRRVKPILVAALAAIVVAALGASATDLGPWYANLRKPWYEPPDVLFGPAWTVIYALTAMAGVIAWSHLRNRRTRLRVLGVFALNAALNVLWSELFFGFHRPDWALFEVVVFWLSIVLLMAVLWPISRGATAALVPYLVWVSFAGVVNLGVVRLNAPFGA